MNIVDNNDIVIYNEFIKNGFSKKLFEIGKIETYIELKRFIFDLENSISDQILLVLVAKNLGYRIYKGSEAFDNSFDSIVEYLKNSKFLLKKRNGASSEYFVIFKKEELLKFEMTLYEVCLIFRFSSFFGLKESLGKEDVLETINKFSFYDIFNFKRWKRIADWQLFFDGEHLTGNFTNTHLDLY